MDLNALLVEQLTFHWDSQARPRLDGLTDAEYLWEPSPNAWSLRRRGEARSATAVGGGEWLLDFEFPEPEPSPIPTIAWRLGHVIVGVFAARNASHFGGDPIDYSTAEWAPDADGALAQLDAAYAGWIAGVRGLTEDELAGPGGASEGPYAALPYAALVLHINREAIHHLAEVALLRDLYRAAR